MEVKNKHKETSAVVVRYHPGRRSRRLHSRYIGMFLPFDRHFKLKLDQAFKHTKLTASVVSEVRPGRPASAPILQFTLPSENDAPIHDIEIFLGKPGEIVTLIIEAKTTINKQAQRPDISVILVDWDSVNSMTDFSEFDVQAPEEPISGMRFYEYAETAQTLLNDVVTGYTRLAFRERKKKDPDQDLLAALDSDKMLALTLLRQSDLFKSIDQLIEIIEDYTPIVRSLNDSSSTLAAS